MVSGPRAVLIGPPGAGKSTVAEELGRLTGLPVADTDRMVEARTGRSVPDLFVDEGEAGFRAVERACVAEALSGHDGILALGGGAVLDEATQAELAAHPVVFLDVSLKDASRRSGFDQGRPLLALNPRGQWLQLMQQRRPVYERLAQVSVVTDGRTARDVAGEVGRTLGLVPA